MRNNRVWTLFLVLAISACSTQAAENVAAAQTANAVTHPVSGLEIAPVTLRTKNGEHVIRAEVARTRPQWTRGLMFRTEMGADEGMLFVDGKEEMRNFWMRNTVIPLDLIFIDADHKVINIYAQAIPYSETPIPSDLPAIAILELNGGKARELGLKPGDRIDW